MPTLLEIKTNKINGLIAYMSSQSIQSAYLRSIKEPELKDATYYQCMHELQARRNVDAAAAKLEEWEKIGVSILSISEENYPQKLKNIHNPPLILFVLGDVNNFKKLNQSLAIVGPRKADRFACEFSEECGEYVSARGICVISGLALGVDTFAHKGAIRSSSDFPTIAVLGNGLPDIYPPSNSRLAGDILERGGLIISQFQPGIPSYPSNFLDRNRIIAGLADASLVIQAPKRSGSLATARYALEEGRDVLAIPGAINDSNYEGSNHLIKSGAHAICGKSDLLEFFPGTKAALETESTQTPVLSADQEILYKHLKKCRRQHMDQLVNVLKDNSVLTTTLLEMEMSGLIKQEPGNFIRLL